MDSIEDLQNKQLSDDIFIDKQKIDIGKNGESRYVDALHKGWACNRTFLCYFPPPVATKDQVDEEAAAAAAVDHDNLEYITMMEIWKETAELYIEDLEFLLNLPYHKFWSQVIYHKGVHDSLLSYLQHAPRCFNVDSEEIIPEEFKDLHSRIHRLVFLVFLRMATHRESQDCRITPSVYGNLIYDNFLFDIPKILDLCAIYGRGNKELLKKMVENIFQNQNCYMGDLKIAVEHINKALSTIEIQLGLRRNEDNSPVDKLSGLKSVEGISRVSSTDLQDVITYTLDTFGTIHSFLEVYPAACSTFLNGGFPVKMAALYDSVVGNVFPELKHRLRKGDSSVEPLKYKLDVARTFMLKIFRIIIDTCFLLPVLEHRKSANSENFESYLTIISTILSEKRFVVDCESYHPFEDDLDMFSQAGFRSDIERVDYITVGLDSIREEMGREKTRVEKKKTRLIDHLEPSLHSKTESKTSLRENMDNLNINDSGHSSLQPQGAAAASNAVTGIELSSLISQVKDLLPHLGDGFVQVCLDHYNYDVEKVINAVLEDSLPASLKEFDQSMERFEDVKVSEPITEEYRATTLIGQRKNVFDNDEFDVFSRNDIDLAKVHKGKWNKSESVSSKEMKEVTMKLLEDSPDNLLNVYDDEYDDTYDEQSIAANESTTIDELLERRPFEQPRVLSWRNRRVSSSSSEESANEGENSNSVKRDEFVPNPAELREKAEQRRQEKMNRNSFHQHKDVKGGAKGQGQSDTVLRNRSNKEKNKSYVGNHNRRAMADRKRSRGMFPV